MTHDAAASRPAPRGRVLAGLSLAALGVVFGDIGTSPLYALKESFLLEHGVPATPENILGILSLVFWSLAFVISFKYIAVLLKADNRGEGGILALLALIRPQGELAGARRALVLLGLFGAALLYGDGVITPAISVLGALEGIDVATPALREYIVPIAVAILVVLFLAQRRGTAGIGRIFGPVMIVWFMAIGALGISGIARDPSILRALWPGYAVDFFVRDGMQGFLILGSVVLVLTGGEALYADMGHFGRRPIRLAWFALVLPALLLNYFGQGALLLDDPSGAANPFYHLVPKPLLYPMVALSTAAAVVASQALISGAFSLTRQAVQLGYCPRVTVVHTSQHEAGQIYIPEVNTGLMLACLALVIGFKSSTNLAGAYGIAVTGTMAITTVLFANAARTRLGWRPRLVIPMAALFLAVDLAFFSANLVKIPAGGWFPILLAGLIFVLMATWKKGRHIVTAVLREGTLPMELFIKEMAKRPPVRVPGVAVFMTSDLSGAPPVLLHHLKHNKVLHERVILMSVATREIPQVPEEDRVDCQDLGFGFFAVQASYGFMESPNVPDILQALVPRGLVVKAQEATFYLGRETLIPTKAAPAKRAALAARGLWMPMWRKRIFMVMANNARSATAFFGLPPNRVVELGAQVQI
ncbi:MAG: potassium transporter Kup [Gemmatimonadales bacterium]|nr:potassium transporter Kup [Gemmatimonadales bacterium]